jgi:hypothetical protein
MHRYFPRGVVSGYNVVQHRDEKLGAPNERQSDGAVVADKNDVRIERIEVTYSI